MRTLCLPIAALAVLVGCADAPTDASSSEPRETDLTSALLVSSPGDLIGTWELVEQRGYDPDHPEVEQTLTFTDNGRLMSDQVAGGSTSTLAIRYQTDGDRLQFGAVEEMTINGEVVETGGENGPIGSGPEQTWRVEDGQLVIATTTGAEDVYRRAR